MYAFFSNFTNFLDIKGWNLMKKTEFMPRDNFFHNSVSLTEVWIWYHLNLFILNFFSENVTKVQFLSKKINTSRRTQKSKIQNIQKLPIHIIFDLYVLFFGFFAYARSVNFFWHHFLMKIARKCLWTPIVKHRENRKLQSFVFSTLEMGCWDKIH